LSASAELLVKTHLDSPATHAVPSQLLMTLALHTRCPYPILVNTPSCGYLIVNQSLSRDFTMLRRGATVLHVINCCSLTESDGRQHTAHTAGEAGPTSTADNLGWSTFAEVTGGTVKIKVAYFYRCTVYIR